MGRHRGLLSLALTVWIGLMASEARAELISMTLSVTGSGVSFSPDAFATRTPAGANTSYVVTSPAGIAAINGYLAANGSEYRFVSLSGSSNFPGDVQGQLIVTGEIHSVGTAGANAGLTLLETEAGFTSPTGITSNLTSSSTGNFTNQPLLTTGHTASSDLNGTSTPSYGVAPTTPTNPSGGNGAASLATGAIPGPSGYELSNMLSFSLAKPGAGAPDVVDSFGVSAVVTANAIPEPASLVTMLAGMPLPLLVLALLRRRRAGARS